MLTPQPDNKFKKDVLLCQAQGLKMDKLKDIIQLLTDEKPLPVKCRNHKLSGNWSGWWECHVAPDWILIYRVAGEELQLARTGTHAKLFS
jgi:mRNA interferase YafQ